METKKDFGTFKRHIGAIPFEVMMAAGAVWTIVIHDWFHLMTSLFTLTISFAPLWFERAAKVRLPMLMQMVYVAFIFLSMFLGEVFFFYATIWEWDDIMHFLSGILVALGGVMWLSALSSQLKNIKLPIWLQTVFVFSIVSTVSMLWEIAEFTSDELFGTNSQHTLVDTMGDFIYGSLGALIICTLLALHLLGKRVRIMDFWVASYKKVNH